MAEISSGLIGDFPYSIWKHDVMGHLCGYLGVPLAHPWAKYQTNDWDIPANVHGGITFSAVSTKDKPHLDYDGQPYPSDIPMDIFWVGFDCAHWGDWTKYSFDSKDHKWTRDEVFSELTQLAEQAYTAMEVTTNG